MMNISRCVDDRHFEHEIESLMNLRHPCINAIIGIIGLVYRSGLEHLTIVEVYFGYPSLSGVFQTSPPWLTPAAKVKVVIGFVLGLRFVHSFGFLHGHLNTNNILFDQDGLVHITALP
jgi:serine/threonine protein kinase